ncbi:MAG: TetR/AcrR family transcriptional regulator [Deltaproteobacteria bacterium]|nr:TetR/AcrR family transcriptional regulator [Deltaproteobacteria bacterium]
MPKQVDAAAQRREIRSAARRVFARRGVPGTGLGHVARAAGMGRTSLYHYYADKDALLHDLVAETLEGERELFHACLRAEGSVLDRVQQLTDGCVALFEDWASLGRLFIDLRLRDAEGQRRGEVTAELDPLLAGATLIGAIDGLLIQHFLDSKALDPDALRVELRRIVRAVLAP